MDKKVAVVTGANKGIGFAIVQGLCKQFDGDVLLTARNTDLGQQAVASLEEEGLRPIFHQLDITDPESIKSLAKFLTERYGGLDILVNNAGIMYKKDSRVSELEKVEKTLQTNYFGTLAICDALFPLLKPTSRVVHLSSRASLASLKNLPAEKQTEFLAYTTEDQVTAMMNQYLEDVKAGNRKVAGWRANAYGISKLGITLITPIQQQSLADATRADIAINCVCPGYIATDMTEFRAKKNAVIGAETPVFLALLPGKTETKGQLLAEKNIVHWKH